MNDKMLVSVIVPVYNAEKYLARCIDSICTQTYIDLEILLIDDGSRDNSGIICDEYAKKDKRIRVIHRENSGVSITRNIGIKEAKGDYIAFVDADDFIDKDMLDTLVKRAIKCCSDIVMCKYYIKKLKEVSVVAMDYEEVYNGEEDVKSKLLYAYYTDYHNGLYSLCNKLIKRSIYSTYDIEFNPFLKRGEDAWFIFQCLKHCRRVDFIPEPYYYYCQNDNSIMHTLYEDQYEKWVYVRKLLLQENNDLKFSIDYSLFYKEFLYKVAIYCHDLIKERHTDKALNIMKDQFYLEALKYEKGFPFHIRMIHFFIKIKFRKIVVILYKLWIGKEKIRK